MKDAEHKLGSIVRHKLTNEKLLVIGWGYWDFGNTSYKCRAQDYSIHDCAPFEIEAVEKEEEQPC